MEAAQQAGFQTVVFGYAVLGHKLDVSEVRVRDHPGAYAVDDRRLVEVEQAIEMSRFAANVVELSAPNRGKLVLDTKTPFLHHRSLVLGINRAKVKGLQRIEVDGAGIEEVRREAVLGNQHRRSIAGQGFVDQERRVQRHFVLATEAFEQSVEDAVAAANHRVMQG